MNESKTVSLIFANRNRDAKRIRASFKSLEKQILQNFEVLLVDYGSDKNLVEELNALVKEFHFVTFYSFEVPQLLWNKSKAINFGILKASAPHIFIADVDLLFHPETTSLFEELVHPQKFYLFRLFYLDQKVSNKLEQPYSFEELRASDYNDVNGMVLAPTKGLLEINGLDEFFHFYGGEDEDLFSRLETAGYTRITNSANFFYHIWHQTFIGSEDTLLTANPRMKNIRRVNERQFHRNRSRQNKTPYRQAGMGKIITKEESKLLETPDVFLEVPNILADVEHVLREELPSYEGKIVEIEFFKDSFEHSFLFYLRKILRKRTEVYCSMKMVNDMVLKEILYMYRNANYSFKVAEDLQTIRFCIQL